MIVWFLIAFAAGLFVGIVLPMKRTDRMRDALAWYRMVVAAFAHGGGDGPKRDLVEDRGERARKALT